MGSKEKEIISELLNEGAVSEERKKAFSQAVDRLLSSKENNSEVFHESKKEAERLFNSGLIHKATKEEVVKRLKNIYQINEARNITERLAEKRVKTDSYTTWRQLIEKNIDENSKTGSDIKEIIEKMIKASSVQEVDMSKAASVKELAKLKREGAVSSTIKKLDDYLEKIAEIRKKIITSEDLIKLMDALRAAESADTGNREEISNILEELQKVYYEEKTISKDLVERLEKVETDLSSASREILKEAAEEYWKLVVFPKEILVSKGRSVNVRVIGLYRGIILKDITPAVTWQYQDSDMVRIDAQGVVRAYATGETKVFAKYKGVKSRSVKIIAVEQLDQDINSIK